MDYYKYKTMAILEIDEMFRQKKPIAEIIFRINGKYGFGRKLIDERIELIKNLSKSVNKKRSRSQNE